MRDLRKFINESVRDAVNEEMMRRRISTIIKEEISKKLYEDDDSKEKDNDEKRNFVMNGLKDPKFNKAELMRQTMHPKNKGEEDTDRSVFTKKANGTPDADGYVRHFSDTEINDLYQIMRKRQ